MLVAVWRGVSWKGTTVEVERREIYAVIVFSVGRVGPKIEMRG